MVNRLLALLVLLGAALTGSAYAQQAALTTTTTAKSVPGLSLAFDATHGQMSASGYAVNARPQNTAATPTTGTVQITVNVNLISKFKQGTRIKCGAMVLGGEIDTSSYTINGGLETVSGRATGVSSGTAVCTMSIPYSWTLTGNKTPATGLIVAFAVAAVDWDGDVVRSTLQLSGVENLPASGATSKFTYDASL
jgi:hypothetical protein